MDLRSPTTQMTSNSRIAEAKRSLQVLAFSNKELL
jgi:hypothetical protein